MNRRPLTGRPERLYAFTYGWEPIPESVSLKGGRDDRFLLEPVTGAAVVYEDGWVLLDTGFNPDIARDLHLRSTHYVWDNYAPVIPRGDPLVDQVAAAGLSWRSLAFSVISHLHCDHSGGLRLLAEGPPVVIQGAEYEFAMNEAGLEHYYFRTDYVRDGLAWSLIDGDTELAPGLHALATFGHTPGHQSVQVELPDTTVVLSFDAADLEANITDQIPCGTTTHPRLEPQALRSIDRLHALSSELGVEVWPGHDPIFWEKRPSPPDYVR